MLNIRISAGLRPISFGGRADRRHARPDDLGRRARHEHAFGVLGRELPSARRGAGLIQHRRPLRRRLAQMDRIEPVVVPLVLDAMHLGRIGKNPARAVAQHGRVLPASLPELVDQLHIFVRDLVAVVMRGLLVLAGAAGGAVEIAGHHVPADAAFGEMIERRHPPRKRVGRLEREIAGDAEAEMFGDGGHRRNQHQRLVGRRLRGIAQAPRRGCCRTRRRRRARRRETARRTARAPAFSRDRASRAGGCNRACGRADGSTARAIDAPRSSWRRR